MHYVMLGIVGMMVWGCVTGGDRGADVTGLYSQNFAGDDNFIRLSGVEDYEHYVVSKETNKKYPSTFGIYEVSGDSVRLAIKTSPKNMSDSSQVPCDTQCFQGVFLFQNDRLVHVLNGNMKEITSRPTWVRME